MNNKLPFEELIQLLEDQETAILLETGKVDDENFQSYLFLEPLQQLEVHEPDEVSNFFKEIETLSTTNYLAGYWSYELGALLNAKNQNKKTRQLISPLAQIGVFQQVYTFNHIKKQWTPELPKTKKQNKTLAYTLKNLRLTTSQEQYKQHFEKIKSHLENGDTYQVNYTSEYNFDFSGSPLALFAELRQKQTVAYSALIKFGTNWTLSFSPELFFRRSGAEIEVKPMKGTIHRGRTTSEDNDLAKQLQTDPKSHAENIMIVDLLRNDLGKIAENGSVKVRDLFSTERFDTLWQMTTIINAKLKTDTSWETLFKALFPCGSVTGAPKIRTMEIISNLEKRDRGVYCGAIGYIGPKQRACLNVAIRTIELGQGRGKMGTGGGVVHDSEAQSEYEELLLKAKFFTDPPRKEFALIETILWNGQYVLLNLHLARLKDSAQYFDFAFKEKAVLEALAKKAKLFTPDEYYRIRLLLSKEGEITITSSILEAQQSLKPLSVIVSDQNVNSSDLFLYHKTTNRTLYDSELAKYKALGFEEVLFTNEHGEVTEGAISNIIIQTEKKLYTPPIKSGLLAGVCRQYYLEKGELQEKVLFPQDLFRATKIYICNSLRDLREVEITSVLPT
ncbi:MAG: aminodeoxychorismate synthase component I [bacterium]